jgi:hypothetical protein
VPRRPVRDVRDGAAAAALCKTTGLQVQKGVSSTELTATTNIFSKVGTGVDIAGEIRTRQVA